MDNYFCLVKTEHMTNEYGSSFGWHGVFCPVRSLASIPKKEWKNLEIFSLGEIQEEHQGDLWTQFEAHFVSSYQDAVDFDFSGLHGVI